MPARSAASAVVARGRLRRCACGCRRRTEQHNLHGLRPIPRRATPRAAPPRLAGLLEKQPPTALVGGTIQTRPPCKPNLVMAGSIHTLRMVWKETPSLEYLPLRQVGGRGRSTTGEIFGFKKLGPTTVSDRLDNLPQQHADENADPPNKSSASRNARDPHGREEDRRYPQPPSGSQAVDLHTRDLPRQCTARKPSWR